MPSTSPSSTWNETPSTALTTPSSVRKRTFRSFTSSSLAIACLPGLRRADTRVKSSVEDVDDRVREHDEDRAVDDRGHDHGQVEPGKRVVGEEPDAGKPEDDLDQERAPGDEDAEV